MVQAGDWSSSRYHKYRQSTVDNIDASLYHRNILVLFSTS